VEACEAVSDGIRYLRCGLPSGSKAVYVGALVAGRGVFFLTLALDWFWERALGY
jgi:hypothetical protein